MNIKYIFYTFSLLLFSSGILHAQNRFVEGSISYVISSKSSATEAFKPTGTFTVTFKDGMIRKDIKMANGYNNAIIINGRNSSVYSLRTLADDHYAVQMEYAEHLNRQKKYEGFSLDKTEDSKNFEGYTQKKATVTYKDGTTSTIYYTPDLQIEEANLFERFPGIKYLPLIFDFSKDDGTVLHLELQKAEAKPVETSLFVIPAGHKVISAKELKELNK